MAALPYMQLYVADYLADTMHLDAEEHGAYLLLLMNYWQTGKPLPDDDTKLARIARTDVERWLNVRSTVVQFFVNENGTWVHNRVEKDLKKVRERSVKAREAGKKSGEIRQIGGKKPSNQAKNERTLNERSTIAERLLIYTDTDTDTDINPPPPSEVSPPREDATQKTIAELATVPARKKPIRGTRLPADWELPDDWRDWAMAERGLTAEAVSDQAQRFRDYWHAASGQSASKCDWQATWRNWIRNARTNTTGPPGSVPKWQQAKDQRIEIARQIALEQGLIEVQNGRNDTTNRIDDGDATGRAGPGFLRN